MDMHPFNRSQILVMGIANMDTKRLRFEVRLQFNYLQKLKRG